MSAASRALPTETSPREFTWLWIVATTLYGVGDILTTMTIVRAVPNLAEGNALIKIAFETFGTPGLVGVKLAIFACCFTVSIWGGRADDRLLFYTPPMVLAVIGAFSTVYNLRLFFGI